MNDDRILNSRKKDIKILYAEDSKLDFIFYERVITNALEDTHNVTIKNCTSAHDACFELEMNNDHDLIILDLNLIDTRGRETFDRVKEICIEKTPIIIVSGLDDVKVKSQCIKAGAGGFVVKGTSDNNLISMILSFTFDQKKMESNLKYFKEA